MEYSIIFTDECTGAQKVYSGRYKGWSVRSLTEGIVKRNLHEIGKMVSYIGTLKVKVIEYHSGEQLASGTLEVNCFSGRDVLTLKVNKVLNVRP